MVAIGQMMGAAAFSSGGFGVLMHSGNPLATVFMLVLMLAGAIVVSSFIVTRILKRVL